MDFSGFWSGLSGLNRALFVAAAFFSVFFVWQMISAFIGLGGDGGVDDGDASTPDTQDHPPDTHDTVSLFKMVSIRSILAFATLFTWASALYMSLGNMSTTRALLLGLAWGLSAMVAVALILNLMRRMTHSGNIQLSACVGTTASVYLDIPAGGIGEIRAMCDDVMTHVKARATDGAPIKSGTSVRVARMTAPDVVEVEPLDNTSAQGKEGVK
jgi:hypothetical protein